MRISLSNENVRNFLCVLFFVFSIYFVTAFVTFYHQYRIVKSNYMAEQYDNKSDVLNLVGLDLELITICQNEIYNFANRKNKDKVLLMDCAKNSGEFNAHLELISKYFNLDSQSSQKIEEIISRKNQLVLDQRSIMETNQILDQLHMQLSTDNKPEKLPHYF